MKETHTKSHYEKKFNEELTRLNAEQRRAVEHIDGPVMVIAGPGTGKTQIIAARIGYILKSDIQIAPHNILCLTYTDAGTVAMRNRLLQFIGPTAYRVNIYTFHAFCNDIIQHNLDYFGKREMEPISELETVQLLREMLDVLPPTHALKRLKGEIYYDVPRIKDLFRTMKEEDWTPKHVSAQIDKYLADLPNRDEFIYKKANAKTGVKVGDVKQKDVDAQKEKMELLRATALLFPTYCEMMKEHGRYDYSDMILWVLNAFKQDKNFLSNYQEWYQYFLIDEYQDTSGAQNELLQLLIDYWEKPNAFVVGDDDQCIYEFQGARVKNMTQFFERYADIEVVVLKENYRSTQKILDASKAVIDNNVQRLINQEPVLKKIPNLSKTLIASNPIIQKSAVRPRLIQYYNIQHEEASVVEEISKLKEEEISLNEVAIIYFKHAQANNIIDLLEKKEIPYSVKKKIDILNLTVTQQVLNILSYLKEEHDKPYSGEYRLFEMMHYHFFEMSPRDIAKISAHCGRNYKLTWRGFLTDIEGLKALGLENLDSIITFEKNLNEWISEVSNSTLTILFQKVLNQSNLLKSILNAADRVWLLQVTTTFYDFIKAECEKNPLLTIFQFTEMIQQMREANIAIAINKIVYEENGVNLITAHSAKGLEFRYVYLIGCTTDNWERSRGMMNKFSLPDTLTSTQKDEENKLESARRLFYVGMTRAKEHLQISFSENSNTGKALEHTIYIEEIKARTDILIEKQHLPTGKISEYTAIALTDKEISKPETLALNKDFINAQLADYSLSVTHLNKYLKCSVAFYYENILRVPSAKNEDTAFGTAIHSVLKWLFDEMLKSNKFPTKDEFLNIFRRSMLMERSSFSDLGFKNKISLGEKNLPAYYDKYINLWNKNVKLEVPIKNIESDGVPINGKLDKIEFTENEVNVIDYKTGNPEKGLKGINPPSEKEPNGGDYWRQIVFYKILLDNYKRSEWKMISGEIDFILKDEKKTKDFIKIKLPVTKEDVLIVKNQIKDVYGKIMNHEFMEGCEDEKCRWCTFIKSNRTILTFQESSNELFEN